MVISATSTSMFAVGQVTLGGVAWLVNDWRLLLMVLNIPCFLIISYYWILSESVRWLLSKEKFEEAKVVLERVARVNRKTISQKSMVALMTPAAIKAPSETGAVCSFNITSHYLLLLLIILVVWIQIKLSNSVECQ